MNSVDIPPMEEEKQAVIKFWHHNREVIIPILVISITGILVYSMLQKGDLSVQRRISRLSMKLLQSISQLQ